MTPETLTKLIATANGQPKPRRTEIGDMNPDGDWYRGLGYEIKPKADRARFFRHTRVPNMDYTAGPGRNWISDNRSLIIGVLLQKGYQLNLTFTKPSRGLTVIRDGQISSSPTDHIFRLSDYSLKQAWSEHVVITKDDHSVVCPVADIESCRAYLSPVYLDRRDSHAEMVDNSVAWMDINFNEDLITVDTHARILHSVYQLIQSDTWGYTGNDPDSTRRAGLNTDSKRLFNTGDVYVIKNKTALIDVLYSKYLANGSTRLFSSSFPRCDALAEHFVSVDVKHATISYSKAEGYLSAMLSTLKCNAPEAWKSWEEFHKHV